jgi:hypothetical protein
VENWCSCRHTNDERKNASEFNSGTSTSRYREEPHMNDTMISTPHDCTHVADRTITHVTQIDVEASTERNTGDDGSTVVGRGIGYALLRNEMDNLKFKVKK